MCIICSPFYYLLLIDCFCISAGPPTCTGAYGYGIMEVTGAGLLEYTFVDTVGAVHDTWRIVKTGM
jgi:hypothetical protein